MPKEPKFHGALPALITPMDKDGNIDVKAFQELCNWQINSGVHGLVPVGTTGESPTLSHEEHIKVISLCAEVTDHRLPIIAGTGSNNTEEAIFLSKAAQKLDVDALLVVTPYYNKPSQEGLFHHFSAIANAVDIPIIIYNIPSRSIVNIEVDTFYKLKEHNHNIIGVKDATADLSFPLELKLALGDDFILLSGEDPTAAAFLAQGGHGIISVSCNISPELHSEMQNAWVAKDMSKFKKIRDKLLPISKACFIEPSPAPTKYALSLMNKCQNQLRLPMLPVSQNTQKIIQQCLKNLNII